MKSHLRRDDKFFARKADAFVRQERILERAVRNGDVHHDLRLRMRDLLQIVRHHFELQESAIDIAGAAGRVNRDRIAGL